MDGRSIPGFYFDQNKNKYFRIQANHIAPKGINYSRQEIAMARGKNKKRKHKIKNENRRRRVLIQRSRVTHNPFCGIYLSCETGSGLHPLLRYQRPEKVHALGLQASTLINFQTPLQRWPIKEITSFDYHAKSGSIVAGISRGVTDMAIGLQTSVLVKFSHPQKQVSLEKYDCMALHYSHPPICSVNMGSDRYGRGGVIACSSEESEERIINRVHMLTLIERNDGQGSEFFDLATSRVFPILSNEARGMFRVCVPCPFFDPDTPIELERPTRDIPDLNFVVGIGRNIMKTDSYSLHDIGKREFNICSTQSDVLSIIWLSATTIAIGLRNREVLLLDLRSSGIARCLVHGGSVGGLARAGSENEFVCQGFPDSLSLYDLRMILPPSETISRDNFRPPASLPLLQFQYNNKCTYPLGLDVSPSSNLMASADEDGYVQIYSLRDGANICSLTQPPICETWCGSEESLPAYTRQIESIFGGNNADNYVSSEPTQSEASQIKCLRFIENESGMANLLAASGPRLFEWRW